MDRLLHKYAEKVKWILEGFDRIVFKGILKPLCYAKGMQGFLGNKGVLNKDYKDWVIDKSTTIVEDAKQYALEQCGTDIKYLSSSHTRKEAQAHDEQKKQGILTGLIGVWACVESCNTYKAVYDSQAGFPQINSYVSRCKHLYFYYDHQEYGFMSIRLQTWAPFEIQIALNGREWLKRLLDKTGIRYVIDGNKFLDVENYELAQELMNTQLDVMWIGLLEGLTSNVFPSMASLFGNDMSYTWTLWQSEWAKDYIFHDPLFLQGEMAQLLRHAFITGTGERILRYMGHPVRPDGQPHWAADPELISRLKRWYDGGRIRHWVDKNSLKFYNEQNVLRFEFTMNNPAKFKIYRTVEGDDSGVKKFLPMRKGIADISARSKICGSRIKNLTEQMATLKDDLTVSEIISKVDKPVRSNGKRYRALEVTGKDLELLRAVSDPKYSVDAITNKHLREALSGTAWANGLDGKKLSARISRQLRLLREHGLIKKLPNQHRYLLTDKGKLLTSALAQFLGAKLCDLAALTA